MKSVRHPIARYAPFAAMLVFAVTVSCGGSPVPCDAAEILVTKTADTNDGVCSAADCSLREAVIRANTCPGTQTIRIPGGTYTLTHTGIDENAAATGDLDLTDSVNILGNDRPVIDGNAADRIFDVKPGVTANLSGLVIQNGFASYGAGIWSNSATLNVNESVIQNNHTTWEGLHGMFPDGGGILSERSGSLGVYLSEIRGNSADSGGGIAVVTIPGDMHTVMLSHTIVAGNTADALGGGVFLDTDVTATLIRFEAERNSAGVQGSGIYNNGDLEFTSATLEENFGAESGGGIFNASDGTFIARDAMLSDNEAERGGGIYNLGMAHFYESSIVYNTASADEGGGVYNGALSGLLLENTTVSSNDAATGGDGIFNNSGNFRLMFVTIASNASEGIFSTGAGEMTMRNTILAGHPGGNCVGSLPDSIGHNIDDGVTCALDEPSDFSSTNPMLDPLHPVGTWSPYHMLQAGSPAIDTADPDRCAGIDQRGVIRPQGTGCDRGAVERDSSAGGGEGSISGLVWHDLCAVPDLGYPPTPPPGCADPGGDGLYTDADGIYDPSEPGIPGITVRLKAGNCAVGSDLMMAVTDAAGEYSFSGLAAGTYCVSVDALGDGNDLVLIPGGWTFPTRGVNPITTEILLGAGETLIDVNFGWDYQFLPAWEGPVTTPTPTPMPFSFINPWISTDRVYYQPSYSNYQCDPAEVMFRIDLSNSEGVANVNLFVRLKEQSSGILSEWSSGVPMSSIGNNQYQVTLPGEDIPGSRTFSESWVQYQFVALDAGGNALARSEVFWNLTFAPCGFKSEQ
jgi:CSLREA domain-containing protein